MGDVYDTLDPDPITVSFTDTWLKKGNSKYVWGSYKDFRKDAPWTEAPRPFLGLLIDGHIDGCARNRDRRRVATIKWDGTKKRWQMKNGYHYRDEDARAWLIRNGFLTQSFTLTEKSWDD